MTKNTICCWDAISVVTVLPGDVSNIHLNLVWFPHTFCNKRELLVKETVAHVVCV